MKTITISSTGKSRASSMKGFSLIEMMLSLVVASIILGAIMTSFLQNRNIYDTNRSKNEILQNSRSALDLMSRDMRSAGYGLSIKRNTISDWVTWINGIDSNPYIIQGNNGSPDQVYMLGAYGSPVGETTTTNRAGSTSIPYTLLLPSSPFNSTDHFLVYIGKAELARIIGNDNGSLRISTAPRSSKGLKNDYAPGTPIELISTVHYSIASNNGAPYLARDASRDTYSTPLMRMCAMNIDDLQFNITGDTIDLNIVARSEGQHIRHQDPLHNDHWLRHTISSRVQSRNLMQDP